MYTLLSCVCHKIVLWEVRVGFDLVHSWLDASSLDESLDGFNVKVTDTNGSDLFGYD